jgi:two-component system cell cycle response regulator
LRTGGHTTVIQRLLDERAQRPPSDFEDTTTTIAVMLRVLPPLKALVVVESAALRQLIERRLAAAVLEVESIAEAAEGLRRATLEFRPLILTDSPEFIQRLRSTSLPRPPFVVYVAPLDDSDERWAGLSAGADECIAQRSSDREWMARIASGKRIAELESVLRTTLADNRRLSAVDELTRVASRRFFAKHFPREVDRAARYGRALSLILCDIDHFKKINDTLGHQGGDDVLKQFGPRLQQVLRRGTDWVARLGGEEFAVVLPETSYEPGCETAKKLRALVAHSPFSVQGNDLKVTASFGVCGLDKVPAGERKTAERMLKAADAALYRSKNDGRNRVTGARSEASAAEKG